MAMDGEWHFVVAPYFWFSGLDGTVSYDGPYVFVAYSW
jgi:hypothetical protein